MLSLLLSGLAHGAPLLVDFLDIGQGDAILIQGSERNLLIDAGDRSANTEQQLHQLHIKRLDWVFATHPHADHIGRMPGVLREFSVGAYFDSGLTHTTINYQKVMQVVAEQNIPYRPARRGDHFELGDGATIEVLLPEDLLISGTRSNINSNSVIMLLTHGEDTILFTGDAEIPTERKVIRQQIGTIDVLKVPHHGSHHSTHAAFAQALSPDFSVISVGENNRYRHPSPETIHTLESLHSTVFRTDLSKHVRLISYGDGVEFLEGPLAEIQQIAVPSSAPVQIAAAPTVLSPPPTTEVTPQEHTTEVTPQEHTTTEEHSPKVQPVSDQHTSWWSRWRAKRKAKRAARRAKKMEFYF